MASFLAKCACRGARPKKVELKNRRVREHLIAKLISQRNVLRFIKAPNGFGKSTLTAHYADLVFAFKNVFWVNCKSPCFIRDLDAKEIVNQVLQLCEQPKLIVFDDYENMDEDRLVAFSEVIDNLLECGCEVIICASPFNDSILRLQSDAYVLKAKDMLLTDDEVENTKLNDISRIPVVAWSQHNDIYNLLKCALAENFTDAIIFSLFFIYLFQDGNLNLLSKVISKSEMKLLIDFNKEYLYFGIDENKNSFSVPYIFTSKLISLFNSEMQTLINVLQCTDRSDLAEKLCSLLEDNAKNETSLNLVSSLGNKTLKINTLKKLNEDSIRNLYITSATDLFDKLPRQNKSDGSLAVFNALRLAVLGRVDESVRYSYSVLDNSKSSIDNKLLAALIFIRFGNTHEIEQSLKILRHLNSDFKIESFLNSAELDDNEHFKCRVINKLVEISFAIHSNSKNPFDVWCSIVGEDLQDEDLISAELIISSYNYLNEKHFTTEGFNNFISKLSRYFNLGNKINFNFYTYAFLSTYMNKRNDLRSSTDISLWDLNNELYRTYSVWKNKFSKQTGDSQTGFEDGIVVGKHINSDDLQINSRFVYSNEGIPKLKINIFGGLTAFIGDKEIINTNFGRQNIKLMCCVLTIENGNEISKKLLAKIIWPDCDEECQRVNINSHWSIFRRLFTLENNECPYLIKNQNSYKFASNYFESDLQSLDQICSDLTLGSLDSQSWLEIINKNENIINGSLLPSETENAYINQKRTEYRNKVVDALVAASERLIDAGEIQQALWFSHKAYSRDDSREDVYAALMRAQLEAGQRTPAIETYFACKKFLEEDLGLEPSRLINNLYSQVVSANNI